MTKNEKILNQLRLIAEDVEPVKTARIAAAIAIGGTIVGLGVNQKKSHPLQARFTKHSSAIYQHAEISAIHNALKRVTYSELAKATLYVVRRRKNTETKHWEDGSACPCEGCQKAINFFRIGKVVHTENS